MKHAVESGWEKQKSSLVFHCSMVMHHRLWRLLEEIPQGWRDVHIGSTMEILERL